LWRDREIKEVLDKQVITGRVPQSVPIYAEFFSDKIPAGGSSADSRCPRCSPDVYGPAQEEMKAMFAIRDYSPSCSNNQSMLIWKGLVSSSTYEEDIQTAAEQMANGTFLRCGSFADCSSCDLRQKMTAMSLGDELRVTPFRWIANETNGLFTAWLQQQGVSDPSTLGCSSWTACPYWSGPYPNASEMVKPGVPEQWYYSQVRKWSASPHLYSNWSCCQDRLGTNICKTTSKNTVCSQRFMHDAGIAQFKQVTDALHKHLPFVRVGMNQSPITPPTTSTYTGNPVHSMIRCFREGCLDLPW
jgi:hypothetical protein